MGCYYMRDSCMLEHSLCLREPQMSVSFACACSSALPALPPVAPAPCAMPSSGRMGLHTQPPCSPREAHAGLGSAGEIMRSHSSCRNCCAMLGLCSLLLLVAHRRMRHAIEPHWLPVSCHEANL